jgi:hypothetical protein
MKKKVIPIAIKLSLLLPAMFLLICSFSSCSSGESAELKFKFQQGKTTLYKTLTSVNIRTEAENAPEELVEKLENSATKFDAHTEIERHIEKVNKDSAIVSLTNNNLGGTMVMGGKETKVGPDNTKNETITFELDTSGKILSFRTEQDYSDPALIARKEEQIKTLQQVVLPNRKVRPGYKWTETFSTPIGLGAMEIIMGGKITYKYIGMEEQNGERLALVEFEGDLANISDKQDNSEKRNFSGRMSGKIYFDTKVGEIASHLQKLELKIEATGADLEMQWNPEAQAIKITTNASIVMATDRIKESEAVKEKESVNGIDKSVKESEVD